MLRRLSFCLCSRYHEISDNISINDILVQSNCISLEIDYNQRLHLDRSKNTLHYENVNSFTIDDEATFLLAEYRLSLFGPFARVRIKRRCRGQLACWFWRTFERGLEEDQTVSARGVEQNCHLRFDGGIRAMLCYR